MAHINTNIRIKEKDLSSKFILYLTTISFVVTYIRTYPELIIQRNCKNTHQLKDHNAELLERILSNRREDEKMFTFLRPLSKGGSKATKLLIASNNAKFSTFGALQKGHANSNPHYHNIITESHGKVGLITLNRPKALNALSSDLFHEVNDALVKYDDDSNIGAIVITGSERAFAAGADIKEMSDQTFAQVYKSDFLGHWGKINDIKKPTIAAVNGFALGGGCELAMCCDIIYAGEKALFGQPEIKLGVIPGAGGTQRLVRAIGKSKAMEIVLSGRNFSAQEAERWGLVSKILPSDKVLDEAIKLGQDIANLSQPAIQAAKESINAAFELSLKEGCHFERRLFQSLFSLNDQKEGMSAFVEKREPKWTND
ncbi:6631_t:CDS:2 [Funneliformis caledonium]|uniref:Probable enoyl-CoA hydratase, mitochondrial n=1 Tax=Funneliformis caledonium TaxID=1117310 RepID=A0A9N8Z7C7_9GLOM|nr:6631_t:CDS:2 [Funneliformis caledonium]